jgi:diadenosine tetraphosphate (Ap4A) HIT family hydrolase
MKYSLDNRLKQATLPIGRLELCEIRLLNDARWPWLLLVPMRDDMAEIFDLAATEQNILTEENVLASVALKKLTGAEKINTAAIGNIVRQLHVHVIARSENDANWPGPVWGFGQAEPYNDSAAKSLIDKLRNELNTHVL